MEIYSDLEAGQKFYGFSSPVTLGEQIAQWVSRLLNPLALALAGVCLLVITIGSPFAFRWAGVYILLTMGIPVGYILWKVRRGEITDFHMRLRHQRLRPMLLMLVCSLAALGIMFVGDAPIVLRIFAAAGAFQTAFLLLVTLRWKISGHSTAIASLAIFLWALYGAAAAPACLAVPLVAWARVRLDRHSMAQTVAGTLAGVGFMWITLHYVALQCGHSYLLCK